MSDDEGTSVRVRTVLSATELADDDTEVWLLRTPLDFDAAALAAAGSIKVDDGAAPGTVLHVLSSGKGGGGGYELLVGEPSEGQVYQVLAQQQEEEEKDGDDEEEDGPVLRIPKPITRTFVVSCRAPTTPGRDGEGEGGSDNAEEEAAPLPPPAVPLVVPYVPIAQVPDLQVRFKPAGAGTPPPPSLPGAEGKGGKRGRSEASAAEEKDGGKGKKGKKDKKR